MNEQSVSSFDSTNNSEISPKSLTEMNPQLQTVILFDWDDTLFCTKYLEVLRLNYNEIFSCQSSIEEVCSYASNELKELEQIILNVFWELLAEKDAKIFIVSNADLKWIENCLIHFLPDLNDYIKENEIKLYSAKNMYSSNYSLDKWKAKCFRKVLMDNFPDQSLKLRVLSLGDSLEEKKAALEISGIKYYNEIEVSFIEMIKGPSIRSIIQQLTFFIENYDKIYESKNFLHQICFEEKSNAIKMKCDEKQRSSSMKKMLSKKRGKKKEINPLRNFNAINDEDTDYNEL